MSRLETKLSRLETGAPKEALSYEGINYKGINFRYELHVRTSRPKGRYLLSQRLLRTIPEHPMANGMLRKFLFPIGW